MRKRHPFKFVQIPGWNIRSRIEGQYPVLQRGECRGGAEGATNDAFSASISFESAIALQFTAITGLQSGVTFSSTEDGTGICHQAVCDKNSGVIPSGALPACRDARTGNSSRRLRGSKPSLDRELPVMNSPTPKARRVPGAGFI